MATTKSAVTSLLTEHFRYTPLTLLDDIINTVNELIYRAVTAVEEGLSSTSPAVLGFADRAAAEGRKATPPTNHDNQEDPYPESRAEIEEGVHQLETLLQATVDKNFDKLEIYVLRNILSVPDDVAPFMRLAHYDVCLLALLHFGFQSNSNSNRNLIPIQLQPATSNHSKTKTDTTAENQNLIFPPSTSTSQSTDSKPDHPSIETLHTLRRKLTETRKLHAVLLAERNRNELYIAQLKALLFSPSPLSDSNLTQTTTTTSAVEKQTPSLAFLTSTPSAQNLGLSLSPSLSSSHPQSSGSDQNPQGQQQQRKLTAQTRELIAHLPALKSILQKLKPYTSDAHPAFSASSSSTSASTSSTTKKGDKILDERREYIEAQVRGRMIRDGLDVDVDGSGLNGQNGAGAGAGAKAIARGAGDVSGIERIAGIVSSSAAASRNVAKEANISEDADVMMEE